MDLEDAFLVVGRVEILRSAVADFRDIGLLWEGSFAETPACVILVRAWQHFRPVGQILAVAGMPGLVPFVFVVPDISGVEGTWSVI